MNAVVQTPKPGDRVIYRGDWCDDLVGQGGVVVRVRKDGVCWVKFDSKPGHRGYPIDPGSLQPGADR